jgi:hypothetical protein
MLSQLNKHQNDLNQYVSNRNYQGFQYLLAELLREQMIVRGNPVSLYVWVKPIRKKFLQVCSGKKCFENGFYKSETKLYKITCCQFHTYCHSCLHDYIIKTLELNRDVKVGCEGCNAMGCGAPDKYLEENEMKKYISEDEFNECIRTGLRRQFISTCIAGYEHCQFKKSPMLKDQYKDFDCCGKVCLNCYGTAVENYIRNIIKIIKNDPKSLHRKQLSIMCIKEHRTSSYYPPFDQLKEIIKHSASPDDSRASLLSDLRDNFPLFQRGVIIFCTNCRRLSLNRGQEYCESCEKCFKCGKDYHRLIDCSTFAEYLNSYSIKGDILTPIKDINDENHQKFMKANNILTEMHLDSVKIQNFCIVTPSSMIKYRNHLFCDDYREVHDKFLLSTQFDSVDPVDEELNDGLKLHNDNCYHLYEYNDNEIKNAITKGIKNREGEETKSDKKNKKPVHLIAYKVYYTKIKDGLPSNSRERHHFRGEREDLILYREGKTFRFSNIYAAEPCYTLILNITA